MSVTFETSLGDFTVDLYTKERPKCSFNFLKLCMVKYYNYCRFFCVQKDLAVQSGDPSNTGNGGTSIYNKIDNVKYFQPKFTPIIKHNKKYLISMVNNGSNFFGSQFLITTSVDPSYLDGQKHVVFGQIGDGCHVVDLINNAYVNNKNMPLRDIWIYHTVVLFDPFDNSKKLESLVPASSPLPTREMLNTGNIGADETLDTYKGMTQEEIQEVMEQKEAQAQATLLEMVGDIDSADMKPPENVLFVCKLNPVTTDEDLEIIFSRFGNILSCEILRDHITDESLQYGFIEFENKESAEEGYFKMDNVLIDDRRIHVDFSQSVSKLHVINPQDKKLRIGTDYVIKDKRKHDKYQFVFDDKLLAKKMKSIDKRSKKRRIG
ncbi:Peptidyl-prolyl cis-trans isomerase-like 4 [Intoshia linei]|uniref:Peptidyl-prolyl cis-trans isomerase n=1 Tax=Intoshia linei TaxID=1819745 RepID=A0A177AUJ6_9BILA|nr:Peptidyl-prolyl cis-trans isomerase-like 4 [Intoshia linei]